MSGTRIDLSFQMCCLTTALVLSSAWLSKGQTPTPYSGKQRLVEVSRSDAIAVAKRFAEHRWIVKKANRRAVCVRNYRVVWQPGESVTGVAYNWGGMDQVNVFDARLAAGHGAGAHKRDGVTSCTTGIDCSGLLSLAWGQKQKYGTASISEIADLLNVNVFQDLKPGDALNKPGSHIVVFAGYNPDGTINVFEASGDASRVIFQKSSWTRFRQYVPIRYKRIID
jgi:hypothetical protein